ncbi:hypothetical protein GCM10023165_47760 [Variovorax defluvii]|uniref:Uncharacterized protein n=1 Tax=Variovorax defluvii TaxID=913761 RepID=A0ABP8IBQ7_9BURK
MSHWAPVITSWLVRSDGVLAIAWSLDPGSGPSMYTGSMRIQVPPELSGQLLKIKVEVKNEIQGSGWVANTVTVRSARNFHSLRAFLGASHVTARGGTRQWLGGKRSLRQVMGLT